MLTEANAGQIKDLHFLNSIDKLNVELMRTAPENTFIQRWLIVAVVPVVLVLMLAALLWHTNVRLRRTQHRLYAEYNRWIENPALGRELKSRIDPNGDMEDDESHGHDAEEVADLLPGEDYKDENTPEEAISASGAQAPRYKGRQLSEQEKERILEKVVAAMDNTELICSSSFRIQTLADAIDGNARFISQTVNEKFNANFATVLAEYRIKAVCRRLRVCLNLNQIEIERIFRGILAS